MSKPAEIEPRWLVSLMSVWTRHTAPMHQNGYPNKVAWLSIPGGSTSPDPTGFCAADFSELEQALEELKETAIAQLVAMMMFYKPWSVQSCIAEGWPFGNSTYFWRLHEGHKKVAASIEMLRRIKESRTNSLTMPDQLEYSAQITVD